MPPAARPTLAAVLRGGPLTRRHLAGSTFGPYEVVAELGRGAFGLVVRARRLDGQGPDVALKVLLDHVQGKEGPARRFQREALLSQALRHPGIVPALDAGEVDGLAFIAFELIEGRTLQAELEPPCPLDRALDLVTAVARAVGFAHAQGVVHRDLKPQNVLVRARDGAPLVTDFGLAKDTALDSSLTKTGVMLGTPVYMSPEQVSGKPATPASDVFALGIMLYQAVAGAQPFPIDNVATRFAAILERRFDPPGARRKGAPAALNAVVRRALAPDPAERHTDAAALADAIDAARGLAAGATVLDRDAATRQDDVSTVAEGPGAGPSARRRRMAIALLSLALLVAALAAAGAGIAGLVRTRAAQQVATANLSAATQALADAIHGAGPPLADAAAAVEAQVGLALAGTAPGDELAYELAQAQVALGAARLLEGELDAADAALDDAARWSDRAGARPVTLLVVRDVVLVARGRAGEVSKYLFDIRPPIPLPDDVLHEARARAQHVRGGPVAALRHLERAVALNATPARLQLRARWRLDLDDVEGGLADWQAARAAGARSPDLDATAALALLNRAERALDGDEPVRVAAAARAAADVATALQAAPGVRADPSAGPTPAAGLLEGRAVELVARMAGEREPGLAPAPDAALAAFALLEGARGLDPSRAELPTGFLRLVARVCQAAPPEVRFVAASGLRRLGATFDASRDLRLDDPAADFLGLEDELRRQVAAAGADTVKALHAYRGFTHFGCRVRALLPVCWQAEEEALALYPPGTPGRFHVEIMRAQTLAALGRGPEGRAFADAAVREASRLEPGLHADTLYWRASYLAATGQHEASLVDYEAALQVLRAGGLAAPPHGWWPIHKASCLHALGRHREALEELRQAHRFSDPAPRYYEELEARITLAAATSGQ